jgi:hypothetical protein
VCVDTPRLPPVVTDARAPVKMHVHRSYTELAARAPQQEKTASPRFPQQKKASEKYF